MLAFEIDGDFTHEAVHLLLHLRVWLHADVEVENHLGEARSLDLLQRGGDAGADDLGEQLGDYRERATASRGSFQERGWLLAGFCTNLGMNVQ